MRSYQKKCEVCGKRFKTPRRAQRSCGQVCGGRLRGAGTSAAAKKRRTLIEPLLELGVRFVPITQGKFTKVDEIDFVHVSQWNWSLWRDRNGREYVVRGKSIFLHRHLLQADKDERVDHKNGNGLDNRRDNLRKATATENNRNRKKRENVTSKYKGVSRHCGKWASSIWVNKRKTHLGRFSDEKIAARAYDAAARRLHGEFARVNFPVAGEQPARR